MRKCMGNSFFKKINSKASYMFSEIYRLLLIFAISGMCHEVIESV